MLKEAVDPVDSSAPPAERMPEAPPGMLSTSCEAGTRGESRLKTSVCESLRTHFPATCGVSCGVTLPSVTGWENVTVMAVFDATFCASAAGVNDLTKKPDSEARVAPPEPE